METLQIAVDKGIGPLNQSFAVVALGIICRRLHFQCNLTIVKDGWDSGLGFDGLYRTFFNDNTTYALALANLAMTPSRLETADLIFPFWTIKYAIAVYEKDLTPSNEGDFFSAVVGQPAALEAFGVIALFFASFVLLVTLKKLLSANPRIQSFCSTGTTYLLDSLFQAYAVAFGQDGVPLSQTAPRSLFVLYAVWFIWVTLISAVVCSFLPSFLSVGSRALPFTDIQSFLQSDYSLSGGSLAFGILNESSNPDLRAIAHKKMKVVPLRAVWEAAMGVGDTNEGTAKRLAVIAFDDTSYMNVNNCQASVIAVPSLTVTYPVSFFLAKTSRYRNMFNREYIRLYECGLLNHLKEMAERTTVVPGTHNSLLRARCRMKNFVSFNRPVTQKPIGVTALSSVYWFFLAATGLSILTLSFERVLFSS